MATTKSSQKELRKLLHACRRLMSAILTVSNEERDEEWLRRLSTATRQVDDARRCVRDTDGGSSGGEMEQLAGNLAKLYVRDMLAKEEQEYATDAESDPGREGLHGHTWAISIPDLLSFLQVQGKTGVLHVNIGTEVISLVISEGDLVNAYSDNSPPGLRLGEILVEQGKIDSAKLQAFLVDFSYGRERLGDALEAEGLISHDELEQALEFQVRLIFARLLCSEKAYFRFHVGAVEHCRPQRYNIMQLLLDACRIHDEAKGEALQVLEDKDKPSA